MNKGFCTYFLVSACYLPVKMEKLKLYAFVYLIFCFLSEDFSSLLRSYVFFSFFFCR